MTLQKKELASSAQDSLDEIDQIMNEIEELQQSMANAQAASAASPQAPQPAPAEFSGMEEFQGSGEDASLEETLAELKDDEPSGPNLIDQAIEAEAAAEVMDDSQIEAIDEVIATEEVEANSEEVIQEFEEPIRMPEATRRRSASNPSLSPAEGSVAVKLSGKMTLRLSYEFEGQDVTISFSDGALHVELSDGTEFKIPVARKFMRNAA